MAEKIISPGVFTKEVDQTFLPAAISEIGAAVIGPTVKGPAQVPTVVSSYSEFQTLFGDSFKSGSQYYQYFTSHTAENYLKNASQMTVVRILDGTYTPATANLLTSGSTTTVGTTFASASLEITSFVESTTITVSSSTIAKTDFIGQTNPSADASDESVRFFDRGTSLAQFINNFVAEFNATDKFNFTAENSASKGITISGSSAGTAFNGLSFSSGSGAGFIAGGTKTQGGTDTAGTAEHAFILETLSDGDILNNDDTTARTNNLLISGSPHNLRYEVTSVNEKKGTFNLLIRRGDDNIKRKQILETWNNLSLDPNSNNYVSKLIGDQTLTLRGTGTDVYLQLSGSYPRKSNFVRVKSVLKPTVDYLDENGAVRVPATSESLPKVGSGSSNGGFTGGKNGVAGFDALGGHGSSTNTERYRFYEQIDSTNTQGFDPTTADEGKTAYENALNLLANQDEYDINMILIPGIVDSIHTAIVTKAIDVCEDRGDCFVIVDPVPYDSSITTATTRGDARDSNYAAMYWPWVQVPDNQTGTNRWVPPSVVMGGIYSFNDKVAHPWFAPAGLNRGGIDTAIQAERKLTNNNRDTLYESNVNPIATFPGQGVTVFGQKTLQKKASALDRINVRRLLIALKKFIASSSRFLVFEQNNTATRRRFLNIVNPYLEQVQSNSGLTAFRVVMDDSNNTPDVVDRNILYGQIFVQPTRTAEFIVLDFTVQPTGATFPE